MEEVAEDVAGLVEVLLGREGTERTGGVEEEVANTSVSSGGSGPAAEAR